MLQISFHLPPKYRLRISLVKRRKNLDEEPLLPDLGKVFRAKSGSKLSRYFRLLFENKKIKKLIGANLAALIIASSFAPTSAYNPELPEKNTINTPTVLGTESGIQYPTKNVKITQNYHFFHPGIDLDGKTGDPIYPIMSGRVEKVEYSVFGYGKAVVVAHSSSTKSLYAHLSKIEVSEGQEVTKEVRLGEMGSSGRAFGDHLHLEVHESGRAINPLTILTL
jgi:murein DD-endopeptidase MepM/ murein hydrolase activator NlpD